MSESLEGLTIPKASDVSEVMLAVSLESIVPRIGLASDQERNEHFAERARNDYMNRIRENLPEDMRDLVDIPEELEESEYDSEWEVFSGTFHGTVDVETWLKIADGFCLDIDWIDEYDEDGNWIGRYRTDDHNEIPVLPYDIEPTMGILTAEGLIPSVAIPNTDEGWGDFMGEPDLIASFYVAVRLKE